MLNISYRMPRRLFACHGSIASLVRRLLKAVNSLIAARIAQREYELHLLILEGLSDRELSDMGLTRSQIPGGLKDAARDRARLQRERLGM